MRLFVDVDDTLVRWLGGTDPHPYGYGAEKWEVNEAVLAYIRAWKKENPYGYVVIWSGGGADYAETWAQRLLPGEFGVAVGKQPVFPLQDSDTFIDDSPYRQWAHLCIDPKSLEVAADVPK